MKRKTGRAAASQARRRAHPIAKRRALSLRHLAEEVVILPEDGSLTQRVVKRKVAELLRSRHRPRLQRGWPRTEQLFWSQPRLRVIR